MFWQYVILVAGALVGVYALGFMAGCRERGAAFDRGLDQGLEIGRAQQKSVNRSEGTIAGTLRGSVAGVPQTNPDNVVAHGQVCHANQHSDLMVCVRCDLEWDMNDPCPPECNPLI